MSKIITLAQNVISYIEPDIEAIEIHDIATGLAHCNRYSGQTRNAYSVLQHTLTVFDLAPKELKGHALFHDAAEAYTGDIPGPLKKMIPELKVVDKKLSIAIYKKFGIKPSPRLKFFDNVAMYLEVKAMGNIDHPYWASFVSAMRQYDMTQYETLNHDLHMNYTEMHLIGKFMSLTKKYRGDL